MITFRALRALYWLHDHRHQSVPELPADVVPSEDARIVYDELVEQGAINNSLSFGGGPDGDFEFYLTAKGHVAARNSRDTYRQELALRRYLEWKSAAGGSNPASFQRDDFSGPLSDDEMREAAHHLVDLGLCEGRKTGNGEFYHVEITPKGRRAARQPYLIDDASSPNGPVTNVSNDNYGNLTVGNQVIGGQSHTVTANITQGASIDEVLKAIEQLRGEVAAAPGIGDADRDELLEEIDSLTTKGRRRGLDWLKAALVTLGTQLVTTAGQDLANRALEIGATIG